MANHGDGSNMMWTDLLGPVGTDILPGDLMIEILGRLPVESVLRFKSVCRAWYALFMSPIFIQRHFHIAGSSAVMTNLVSLIVHTRSYEGNDEILSLVLDQSCGHPLVKNLNPPFGGNVDKIQVVGSINGLVCLSPCSNATSIVLWNPAIRECFQIPKPLLVLGSEESISSGFAYDQKTESYKVMRIFYSKHFTATKRPAQVEIYNTRTNAWRTMVVDGFPWLGFQRTCNTVIGGAPYWYAVELQEQGSMFQELMTWFDAADECFRFHPLPCYHDTSRFRMRLGAMGEHPVVIVCSIEIQQNEMVEIWKLNKRSDGGKDVLFWKKKSTVELLCGPEKVIGCWRNGEIIAEDKHGSLFIYDPHPKQIEGLPSYGTSGFMEVYGYTESLVSPSRLAWIPDLC